MIVLQNIKNKENKMLKKVDVVVFDFDGTLSASDSNYEFFKYCCKHSLRPWLFLPLVIAGSVGKFFNPDGVWWRQTLRRFITPKMVQDYSKDVIKLHKQNRFGWAKDQVAKEKKAGNKVLLISASPDYLIPDLVADMKFDAVMYSKMDSKSPWKYEFACCGRNKVVAMDEWAKANKYIPNVVRAYSDSKSDMPIMEIAQEQVWINPKTGLRK
jgi:HAD superfamily phosphoserine phosphatase-like hydrolase